MKGSEFLRKIHDLGRERAIQVTFVPHRGKGGHGTLYFGDKRTIVPSPKNELKKGTFHAMLKQLGIDPSEL